MQAEGVSCPTTHSTMHVQVLGSGCPTCKKLYVLTQNVVDELGLVVFVEYVTGPQAMQQIMKMGVMSSPVLAINGKPVIVGSTDKDHIKQVISKAATTEAGAIKTEIKAAGDACEGGCESNCCGN